MYKNLSYNLLYHLSQERYKIINCIIQENYSVVTETKVKIYFINIGYKEANSLFSLVSIKTWLILCLIQF